MSIVVVREYARLTIDSVASSLDQATVSPSAFAWLCELASRFNKNGAPLLQVESRRWLKLDSFVGVVETPCGTIVEILPKHTDRSDPDAVKNARALLIKMLIVALDLPVRITEKSDIQTFRHPLLEWVMKQFILSLDHLLKRGLRSDYQQTEEQQRYLRGQLDVTQQMRQPPGRAHVFNIRHDRFVPDRPENRLLKAALMLVCKTTKQADNWRLSHELAGIMAEIPSSNDPQDDFRLWRNDRLMAHYLPVRPWCELLLGQHMPLAMRGSTQGISLLFPMEKLFERYVETQLRRQLPPQHTLKSQASNLSLCTHDGGSMFQLRPDFLTQENNRNVAILDTKWKLISAAKNESKYGLSQADFYQMFAYGQKYLSGNGAMLLIYPMTERFQRALPPFHFSDTLRLWVTPFDLQNDEMHWPVDSIFTRPGFVS